MSLPCLVPRVCFDIGHQGVGKDLDPGAVSGDLKEAECVLEVAKLAAAAVRAHGVQVTLTRTGDLALTPSERSALITEDGVACVVSVHADAPPQEGDPGPRGWTVYVSASFAQSRHLGECIAAELERIPIPSRGVKTRLRSDGSDYYYVISEPRKVGIPAVLVECGFVTNPDDAACLKSFWGRFAIAHAIAAGILSFLGLAQADPLLARVNAANERLGQIRALAQEV